MRNTPFYGSRRVRCRAMPLEFCVIAAAFILKLICPPVPQNVVCVKDCVWRFWYVEEAYLLGGSAGVILESEDLHRRAYNAAFEHFEVRVPAGTGDVVDWSTEFYDDLQNRVGGGKPKMRDFFGEPTSPSPRALPGCHSAPSRACSAHISDEALLSRPSNAPATDPSHVKFSGYCCCAWIEWTLEQTVYDSTNSVRFYDRLLQEFCHLHISCDLRPDMQACLRLKHHSAHACHTEKYHATACIFCR